MRGLFRGELGDGKLSFFAAFSGKFERSPQSTIKSNSTLANRLEHLSMMRCCMSTCRQTDRQIVRAGEK